MKSPVISALLGATLAVFGADDPWAKVRFLKSGTELRIFKKGGKQPLVAKMDQATTDNLIVVVKNEQIGIPVEDVDRLDFRPPGGPRITRQTATKTNPIGNPTPSDQRIGGGSPGPSASTATSVTLGAKPDFETIYRRPPPKNEKP